MASIYMIPGEHDYRNLLFHFDYVGASGANYGHFIGMKYYGMRSHPERVITLYAADVFAGSRMVDRVNVIVYDIKQPITQEVIRLVSGIDLHSKRLSDEVIARFSIDRDTFDFEAGW